MTDQPIQPTDIITTTARLRQAVLRRDAQTMKRLIDAYTAMYARVKDKIELLIKEIEIKPLSRGQIQRLAQYRNLISAIEREVSTYGGFLTTELNQSTRVLIAQASRDARTIIGAALGNEAALTARVRTLNPEVIKTLLGFLGEDSAIFKRIAGYPGVSTERVIERILSGVGMGQNPRVIGNAIRDALGGTLTDALRTARTTQIWAYREASRANYSANSDIVLDWIWYANLDNVCCSSCVAMHGTEHPLDEPLDDHDNGRCTAIPRTILNPNFSVESGEDWFNQQDETRQREILGGGMFDAWKDGKFGLSDIPTQRPDDRFVTIRSPRSLKELTGDE